MAVNLTWRNWNVFIVWSNFMEAENLIYTWEQKCCIIVSPHFIFWQNKSNKNICVCIRYFFLRYLNQVLTFLSANIQQNIFKRFFFFIINYFCQSHQRENLSNDLDLSSGNFNETGSEHSLPKQWYCGEHLKEWEGCRFDTQAQAQNQT